MKQRLLTALWMLNLLLTAPSIPAQTIVKMNLPPQSNEAIRVVVLFDEEVPGGMTVVLGVMGYQVFGGIEPFSFEWYQNGKLIGTDDIVSLVPANGDQLSLKVTDKNRCYSQSSVIMKVKNILEDQDEAIAGGITVLPTLITDNHLQISLTANLTGHTARVRFIDTSGKLLVSHTITESTRLSVDVPAGTYWVSVMTKEYHKVERIIVL